MFKLFRMDSEITNRCNAACALCPRTGTYPGGVSEELHDCGTMDLSMEHIEEVLYWANLQKWSYCGNFGDPFVHPKVFEIAEFMESRGITHQTFDTNGSIRTPDWWREFGKIPGVKVNFALDGLSDTNHIYRVNTNFEKIIENALAFMEGGGKAVWVMIVFEHNQHQVEQAKEMAKKLGFNQFFVKKTARRFDNTKQTASTTWKKSSKSDPIKRETHATTEKKYQADIISKGLVEQPISCKAEHQQKMYITPKGEILPCCHVHFDVFKMTHNHKEILKNDRSYFTSWLEENNIKYELDKYNIFEIMKSYNDNYHTIEKRWMERTLKTCNKKCGSNQRNDVIEIN